MNEKVEALELPCRYCGRILPHYWDVGGLRAIRHTGPCLALCLGGGVDPHVSQFHYDACVVCYPEHVYKLDK